MLRLKWQQTPEPTERQLERFEEWAESMGFDIAKDGHEDDGRGWKGYQSINTHAALVSWLGCLETLEDFSDGRPL